MTAPGFGPEQAAHLLQAVHGIDTLSSSAGRILLGLGIGGVGVALALGQVQARMRQSPSVRGSVSQTTHPSREGGAGAPSVDAAGRGRRKVIQDASEVAEAKHDPRISYWGGIFVEGSVILWHGPPKAGKTVMLTEALRSVIRGEGYLGWDTRRTAAVYFSEETAAIWKDKAASIAGVREPACPWWQAWMPPGPVSWVPIRRPSIAPKWWKRLRGYRSVFHVAGPNIPQLRGLDNLVGLMLLADNTARKVGARIIIFDTLKHFCSEAQSASEHADAFIGALKSLAARGYCVIIVHHDNDNGKPLGPKSLQGGVDFLVHQHRITGLPQAATEREVEFDGRFALGDTPEPLRYRLDPATNQLVRIGQPSTTRTVPRTVAPATGLEPATPGVGDQCSTVELHGRVAAQSLAPLPLPVLTPPPAAPTPLRVVKTVPGRDALCQDIYERLQTAGDGPWKRTELRDRIMSMGLLKSRAAAYARINDLLTDGLLTEGADKRLALTTEAREATA